MKRPSRHPDHVDQIDRLLAQAGALPHGPTRVELCEEAVRIADLHNDPELAFRARQELVDAACFGGRPDLLIVAYSWCLATFDRGDGTRVSARELLWRMKWVVGALAKFPEITLPTIHGMLDDMERRFRDYDGCIRPVVGLRRTVALQTGDLEAARAAHKQFLRLPRSWLLSDCPACEMDAVADYSIEMGRNAVGVRKAEELIASGMRCAKVPDTTYTDVLFPMVKLGRAAEAMRYHKVGYPKVRHSAGEVSRWGTHMAFLSLTRNDSRAVKLLETHLPDVEAAHDPLGSLGFFRDLLIVVEGLAEKKEKMKLRLPPTSPFARPEGEYVLADLATGVRGRVLEASRRFDQRNGNSHYGELVAAALKLRKKGTRVPYAG